MGIAMVVLPDPEMDRLRVKNFEKLNYLVKPHERCPFGTSFLMNGFFRKKSNLQHCQSSKLQFLTVSKYSSRSLVGFFSVKSFKQINIKFCLWVLDFFNWKKVCSPKNDFASTFACCFHAKRFCYFLPVI